MKTLILRFDIDTYRCVSEGVPNLLAMARREGIKLSFFCNMGRAASRKELIRKTLCSLRPATIPRTAVKLSASAKLGRREILRTLVLNPNVGASRPDILRQAAIDGHDVGLHGGRNHGSWQHGFRDWSGSRIRREIEAGVNLYTQAMGRAPELFSSPGWQGSRELNSILKETGFTASADRHGPEENDVVCEDGFCTLPTNLVGEPGGVAYFETLTALGCNHDDIVDRFEETLSDGRELYVLYDHPCFAGTTAIRTVGAVARLARKNGLSVVPLSALINNKD